MVTIEAYGAAIGSFLGLAQAVPHKTLSGFDTNKNFCCRSYENFDKSSMYGNLNVSFLKVMTILNDSDVESNPGEY